MLVKERVRGCDLFGAKVQLRHQDKEESGTVVGGIASLLLQILTLTHFCMRLIQVIEFKEPQITSYEIREIR